VLVVAFAVEEMSDQDALLTSKRDPVTKKELFGW
jgi:hypothetical protein